MKYDINKQSAFLNCDCMEAMKDYPNNYFDLAIVDPPYGSANGNDSFDRFTKNGWFERYRKIERTGGHEYSKKYEKKIATWDIAHDQSYFKELFRVSRNQIIWGEIILIFHQQDVL